MRRRPKFPTTSKRNWRLHSWSYRRQQPARRPKLDAWVGAIDQILEDDKARWKKQRHTAKRIFERLRDEQVDGVPRGRSLRPRAREEFPEAPPQGGVAGCHQFLERDCVREVGGAT